MSVRLNLIHLGQAGAARFAVAVLKDSIKGRDMTWAPESFQCGLFPKIWEVFDRQVQLVRCYAKLNSLTSQDRFSLLDPLSTSADIHVQSFVLFSLGCSLEKNTGGSSMRSVWQM